MNKKLQGLAVSLLVLFAAASFCLQPCSALAAINEDESAARVQTDGILVTVESPSIRAFSSDGERGGIEERLEDAGLSVTDKVDGGEGDTIYAVRPCGGIDEEEALLRASSMPGVVAVQPNYVYDLIDDACGGGTESLLNGLELLAEGGLALYSSLKANDPYAVISNPHQSPNQYWLYSSKLSGAWDSVVADKGVTIALLDAAVRPSHEDLSDNVLSDYAWDAVAGRPMDFGGVNYMANSGHGTLTAGVAAGVADNGIGIAGSSFNANLLPIRVFDDNGRSSTLVLQRAYARIIALCSSGAVPNLRVVNMSLGSYSESVNDAVLHQAIQLARTKYGVVTVCAGGNGQKSSDGTLAPRTDPCYPSDFEECVAVTALRADGANVYWSDYNEAKDISAPGEGIWSTYASSDDGYAAASGTSLSAPMVAGAFALLFAAVPNATVDEACSAIYATAVPVVDDVNDRTTTSGSHGALDARAAVAHLTEHHPWQFVDVKATDWCYEAVGFIAERHIMNGYANGSGRFGSNDLILREQAACVFYNYLGGEAQAAPAPQKDVVQGEWYDAGVNWAVENGVMNGHADGSNRFGVGDPLTREQAACVIANFAKADVTTADSSKYDALQGTSETSDWARDSLVWAVDKGILNGVDNGDGTRSLDPGAYVTRAQMAAMMANSIQKEIL